MSEPSRRQFLAAVALAAAGKYDGDPDAIREGDTDAFKDKASSTVESSEFCRWGEFPHVSFNFHPYEDPTAEAELMATYDHSDVMVSLKTKTSEATVSGFVDLSPEQAREFAAALYQAAWEFEQQGDE